MWGLADPDEWTTLATAKVRNYDQMIHRQYQNWQMTAIHALYADSALACSNGPWVQNSMQPTKTVAKPWFPPTVTVKLRQSMDRNDRTETWTLELRSNSEKMAK